MTQHGDARRCRAHSKAKLLLQIPWPLPPPAPHLQRENEMLPMVPSNKGLDRLCCVGQGRVTYGLPQAPE